MPWPTLHLTVRASATAVVTVALAAGVLPGRAAAAGLDGTVPIAPTGVRTCLALDEQLDRWPTPQPCADSGPLRVLPKQDGMPPARQLGFEAIAHYPLTECVRDRVTGLVWEGKPDSGLLKDPQLSKKPAQMDLLIGTYGPQLAPVPGSRANTDAYSYWGDGRAGDAMAYVAQVNALRLCGYTDWRLPTVAELHGLADLGKAAALQFGPPLVLPVVDAHWLPNTVPGSYVSAEPRDDQHMWCVNFGTGYVYACHRIMRPHVQPLFVRLVRGREAPETGRWRLAADENGVAGGVVEDLYTGLAWRRCEEPQIWDGRRCTRAARTYDYVMALTRASEQTGWRLPTVKEMNSLVERWYKVLNIPAASFPAPNQDRPSPGMGYWTSTVCSSKPESSTARAFIRGWAIGSNGNVYCEERGEPHRIRLVRQ